MKKCFLNAVKFISITASLLMFASCTTLPSGAKNFNYADRAEEGNPENSVVFYMVFAGNEKMTFEQDNPKYREDLQTLTGSVLISAPCQPGSHYHCSYLKGRKQTSTNFVTVWEEELSKDNRVFDIKVPTKPGLYYLGFFDGPNSIKNATYYEIDEDPIFWWPEGALKRRKFCLDYVKKSYKGTSWANLAEKEQEEIKELLKSGE